MCTDLLLKRLIFSVRKNWKIAWNTLYLVTSIDAKLIHFYWNIANKWKIEFYHLNIFFSTELYSKDLLIEAKSITIDKDKKVTLFQNNVVVKTADKQITSEFAEYDKEKQKIILKDNIVAKDKFNNIIRQITLNLIISINL